MGDKPFPDLHSAYQTIRDDDHHGK
jgi:hypothetical protein